ncbi:MAG: hypothetical protein FJX44_03735 [Alphaproteobacteria bacterium]|nr:hypothetical protein [Alphaproteobacteria bacterium]
MSTLIICPACGARYETKAVFPPEGRKVRCSKCTHVWQAMPVTAGVTPPFAAPRPAPQATPPQASPPYQAPPPPLPQAPPPRPSPATAPPRPEYSPPPPPQPAAEPRPSEWTQPSQQVDADFETDEGLAAQVAEINAEAMPPPPPEKRGGIFARLTRKKAPAAQVVTATDPTRTEAALAEADAAEAALADADLVAEAMGEKKPPRPPGKRFAASPLTIGWGALILLVALLAGMFLFARDTLVSILPGGSDTATGTQDLAFEDVRYGWTNDGTQPVLEVQGNVRNVGASPVTVPTVIIALRDEQGEEISEFTAELTDTELDAGEEVPFTRQIPSPPSNVRSLKVRFAKAE